MATIVKNVRIRQLDGSGDTIIIYPQTLDTNIIIDSNNPELPSGVASLSSLVDNIGGLAFEDSVGTNITTGDDYTALRITDDPTENDSDVVASSKAVSAVDSASVKITNNQEVGGVKAFSDGINIGGAVSSGSVTGGVDVTYDESTDTITFS